MKLPRATQYKQHEVEAAYAVLLELGVLFQDLQEKMVLIGGFVPWLLLQGPPDHVGTLDVDLNFDIEAFADTQIQEVFARLEKAGINQIRNQKCHFVGNARCSIKPVMTRGSLP
jgi:hypothetical protein